MNAADVAVHELLHVGAAAIMLVDLHDAATYRKAFVHLHANSDGGEAATEVPGLPMDDQKAIARFAAMGPIVLKSEWRRIAGHRAMWKSAGGLSDRDAELAQMSEIEPVRYLAATSRLHAKLNIPRLVELILDPRFEVEDAWPLSLIVPRELAEKSLRAVDAHHRSLVAQPHKEPRYV